MLACEEIDAQGRCCCHLARLYATSCTTLTASLGGDGGDPPDRTSSRSQGIRIRVHPLEHGSSGVVCNT